jgi:hypothetical protein
MFARFIAAMVVVLATSAPAWAAADRKDLQVAHDVSRQVLTYPQFSIFDSVHMQVDNGIVTLTGKVTMPYKKNDIEKARRQNRRRASGGQQDHRAAGLEL